MRCGVGVGCRGRTRTHGGCEISLNTVVHENVKVYVYLHDQRVHVVEMELCIRGEITTQDLSNEPETKALGEKFTSVESIESFVTKK